MKLLNIKEHLNCFNYDRSERPQIEVIKITKGTEKELNVICSEIVFFMEGRVRYLFRDYPGQERAKGQMLFLPAGGHCIYTAVNDTVLIVLRLREHIRLCECFPIERLYGMKQIDPQYNYLPQNKFEALKINRRIWYFLNGLKDCIEDGIKCSVYFEMKVKEFFLMLRAYYSKAQIHDFLYLILSPDTAFSEYVRLNWQKYQTVGELAASMNLSGRQFSSRFKRIFGETAYQWIKNGRIQLSLQELTGTEKSFKQIALDNGFYSESHFTKACKEEFGKTPTEIRSVEKQ